MCASVLDQYGRANLSGVTFLVKTNGKTGMDIRYFFNPVKKEDHVEEEIDVDSLNF
jgi:hypothetical protein